MARLLAKHDAYQYKSGESEAATTIRAQMEAFVSVIDRQSTKEGFSRWTLLHTSEASVIELANRGLTLDQEKASAWWDEDRSEAHSLQRFYTEHYEWPGPVTTGF